MLPVYAQAQATDVQHGVTEKYSGIVINQNATATDDISGATTVYQEFFLPDNFTRGVEDEQRVPSLSGFQVFASTLATDIDLDYSLQVYLPGVGWTTLASGVGGTTPTVGTEVWITVYFDEPVGINPVLLDERFRISLQV